MKSARPLNVVFFKTDAGNEPVRDWLKALPREECKTVGVDILKVQFAWPVGKPLERRAHVSPPSMDFQIPLPGPPPFMQHATRRR